MATAQCGYFSVPRFTVYNGHFGGPVALHLLASVTLAVELSQPVLRNPDLQNQDFLGLELDPSVT